MTMTDPTAPTEKPENSGTTIKPGVYTMRATDADLGFTKGSETEAAKPQVAVLLEFTDGPYAGQSLTWYGYFTEKTKQGTVRSLRLLGWEGDDLSDLKTVRGEAACTVEVEPDLEGVPRARVRWVGGGALALKNVMSEDQKKAFAASMAGLAASIKAPPKDGSKPASSPAGEAPKKFF